MDITRLNTELAARGLEMGNHYWQLVLDGHVIDLSNYPGTMGQFLATHPTVEFRDPIQIPIVSYLGNIQLNRIIQSIWDNSRDFGAQFINAMTQDLIDLENHLLQNDYNGFSSATFLPYIKEIQKFLGNNPLLELAKVMDSINTAITVSKPSNFISYDVQEEFCKFIIQYLITAFRSLPSGQNMQFHQEKAIPTNNPEILDLLQKIQNFQFTFNINHFLEFLKNNLPQNILHIQNIAIRNGRYISANQIIEQYKSIVIKDDVSIPISFGLFGEFLAQESLLVNGVDFEKGKSIYQLIESGKIDINKLSNIRSIDDLKFIDSAHFELDQIVIKDLGDQVLILVLDTKFSTDSVKSLRDLLRREYEKFFYLKSLNENLFNENFIFLSEVQLIYAPYRMNFNPNQLIYTAPMIPKIGESEPDGIEYITIM